MSSPYYKDVLRVTVEAVYRAALTEFERQKRLGTDFIGQNKKKMTAYEAKLHLRWVRYLQATAMRKEGKTLAEIGLLFGVSRQRVDQLLRPPTEYKRPGRPRRGGTATNSREEPKTLMPDAAYKYRLQVRDKYTYLDDVLEIGFLVNSLLDDSKQIGRSLAKDPNLFAEPVRLSDISITLAAIEPKAVEHVWYSLSTG